MPRGTGFEALGPQAAKPVPPQDVEDLARRLGTIVTGNTAIVCVGSDLRGDDAAGVEIARRLSGTVPWPVYDTRNAPENFLTKIAAHKPQTVLLVDALHFDAEPGRVRLFRPDELSSAGQGPSTHGPAPLAFLEMLNAAHPCSCVVLGIQPEHIDLDAALSPPVRRAIDIVVEAFQVLARRQNPAAQP